MNWHRTNIHSLLFFSTTRSTLFQMRCRTSRICRLQITLPTQSQSQSGVQQKTVNAAQTQHQQQQQQTINAQQQVLIEALPPMLVLHIKRFVMIKSLGES